MHLKKNWFHAFSTSFENNGLYSPENLILGGKFVLLVSLFRVLKNQKHIKTFEYFHHPSKFSIFNVNIWMRNPQFVHSIFESVQNSFVEWHTPMLV